MPNHYFNFETCHILIIFIVYHLLLEGQFQEGSNPGPVDSSLLGPAGLKDCPVYVMLSVIVASDPRAPALNSKLVARFGLELSPDFL